jgi:phosphoesterase RecJ-like protein
MTLDEIADCFKKFDDYIVISHDGPDADGLGAAYALVLALRSIGKKAVGMVSDVVPPKFRFIDRRGLFGSLATEGSIPFDLAGATLVILDTHDLHYLGQRAERLLAKVARRMILDHHEVRGDQGELDCLDPGASSTCELVYLIASRLGARLPEDAAEAVFSGIVYDTGSFSYPKTTERTFACALELVRAGVEPYLVHNRMYESSSIGVLILQKAVLSSLELHADNKIALQILRRADLAASGASYEDSEDLINIPLQGRAIEVSILFKENLEGRLRCSLRSKGSVNVAHIAQAFGGGGHKTAAGFTCQAPLERAKADVLQSIGKALAG